VLLSDLILALDVGNSEIVLGLGDDTRWHARWRLATIAQRTSDEYAVLVDELFTLRGQRRDRVAGVVLSSVVPCLTPVIATTCVDLFAQAPLVVGPGLRTGMEVRYEPPSALGTDRLVDAVAARARFGAPVVAVDFGTATTFNVVASDGAFIGGAIAPGVGVAAEAMARAGARLRRIEMGSTGDLPVIGRTTDHSMRSGVIYGFAGLVEGLLARIDAELAPAAAPRSVPVVATGGMAAHIARLVTRIDALEPDLTLDGLRRIWGMNRS
jgi:type III pantothenate kinase